MYSSKKYDDIVPVVKELVKQDDHVFIMVNNNKERDEVTVAFGNNRNVHVSRKLEFAQEGDLSLARGTLLQMIDAFENEEEFDYFINLTEGMLPLKPRQEIVDYLENNPMDHYYIDRSEKDDPQLRKKVEKYYPYTNVIGFDKSKYVRTRTKVVSAFLDLIHVRRKLEDEIYIGSPWFILTKETASILKDNFAYCSDKFKLSWYAEEMTYIMMINKFKPDNEHINKDMRVVGPSGTWQESQGARKLTKELIEAHPEALFGGTIFEEDDEELYKEILPLYNKDYVPIKKEDVRDISSEDFNEMVDKIKRDKDE